MHKTLVQRDLQHIWHPCSQMKDYERFPPLEIVSAKGSYLQLADGSQLIDAISSWWCKSLGHGHPRLQAALTQQMAAYEHVILANTCQAPLVNLSEKLATLSPGLDKVFYASEGSCAVEIALKMSLHAQQINGRTQRRKIMALQNDYHGETLLALSVSDLGLYRRPYEPWLHPVTFLNPIPYINSRNEALWQDCGSYWQKMLLQLEANKEELSAIIVEPVMQGATGMQIYSQDLLKKLRQWCKANQVHLIADEILTGFGRTGYALACEHAGIQPDFICLGKGLTSGWLPMSAVLTSDAIYQTFYDDYETGKYFLHSHTFGGNALAAAVAVETMNILAEEEIYAQVRQREQLLRNAMEAVARHTGRLTSIRNIGGMVAADLIVEPDRKTQRMGFEVYLEAVKLGALLRPLGNTIYWLPPLNIEQATLEQLQSITEQAIANAFNSSQGLTLVENFAVS